MKALLISLSLLIMSFSSFAEDITENQLQSYIKALPAVANWSQNQPELKNVDLGSMLSGSEATNTSSMMGFLDQIKQHELYTEFAGLTEQYGFTPEQLIVVGSEVSMAYLANLKGSLSSENQKRVDQAVTGLQSFGASSANSGTRSLAGALEGAKSSTNVNKGNVNLVKEYMPQLKQLFAMLQ